MPEETENDGTLRGFVASAITQITSALPTDAKVDGSINFEVSTVEKDNGSGKLDIFIVKLGMDASQIQSQKVSFSVKIQTEYDKIIEKGLIAQSEADIAEAQVKKARNEKALDPFVHPEKYLFHGTGK
jgi:hypothetical protein